MTLTGCSDHLPCACGKAGCNYGTKGRADLAMDHRLLSRTRIRTRAGATNALASLVAAFVSLDKKTVQLVCRSCVGRALTLGTWRDIHDCNGVMSTRLYTGQRLWCGLFDHHSCRAVVEHYGKQHAQTFSNNDVRAVLVHMRLLTTGQRTTQLARFQPKRECAWQTRTRDARLTSELHRRRTSSTAPVVEPRRACEFTLSGGRPCVRQPRLQQGVPPKRCG